MSQSASGTTADAHAMEIHVQSVLSVQGTSKRAATVLLPPKCLLLTPSTISADTKTSGNR